MVGVLVGLSLGACDDAAESPGRHADCRRTDRACVSIERRDFGADWPFSVDAGWLACMPGRAITLALLDAQSGPPAAGDDAFGLNRAAHERGYSPPYPIWEWDAASPATDLRKSMRSIIETGLELCG
jgi:hypothetical protein